ncbi:MAG: ATP-binding protein [Novosphingobium sp.]
MKRFWPQSLKGQLLLAVAVALLIAQAFSALLLYRSQAERRDAAVIHAAAFRLVSSRQPEPRDRPRRHDQELIDAPRSLRLETATQSPLRSGEHHDSRAETEIRQILADLAFPATDVVVTRRTLAHDQVARERVERRAALVGAPRVPLSREVLVAGVHTPDNVWLVARVLVPPGERGLVMTLIGQTLMIYAVLVGAIALALRRITRPLAALATRLEQFAQTRDAKSQLEPEGPDDVRRLIVAHNAMEDRIADLLNEKDVMLGAIGHDLKTPLAALRVRIESVEDDAERTKMAATIEDIVRTLDDILSLARVGRPRDPCEPTELSALVSSVVEEFEDMGDPVELGDMVRVVAPLRATWLRRALRNLIGNALRYGKVAHVALSREQDWAVIRITDEGPGIADADIARMQEPFARGEPSRNSETGGAGLGLALARAIADQHGGTLTLANRYLPDGTVAGLTAELRLPLE